jgi:epoxyqueuosine reductase
MDLTRGIKDAALALGFDFIGVTTPETPQHFDIYTAWVAAGRQAEMAYLASERAFGRREDPRRILPECRSVLVLGARYANPQAPLDPGADSGAAGRPRGRVAAYAWGEDYHTVLVERLEQLRVRIEQLVGRPVQARAYTDTGPLLERDLASRAGLGWIGKNTCLIRPDSGSYFFLAELLLDVELVPDAPFAADYCGSCTRCLEACPTACILPDRTLDAGRCISYLTIELKGSIPVALRPQMGEWVFGCDICQEVCPWNIRFAPQHGDPAFSPRQNLPMPDLISELELSPEAFNHKFRGSPVKRAKRRGYLRNVAVALGNAGDPGALPALVQCLRFEPEALVRAHAAWALGCLARHEEMPEARPEARQALLEALERETDEQVRAEIRAALEGSVPG